MGQTSAVIWCLALIVGLLSTAVVWGGWVVLAGGIGLALVVPRWRRGAPNAKVWLVAGILGLLASLYLQWRSPVPAATDISKLFSPDTARQEWVVWGEIESLPRLTRSQKAQFWLTVQQVAPIADNRKVTGRLYVTVPLLQATGLHPGQMINVTGNLYLPKPAANPGGFDFKDYLRQESSFAGLKGTRVEVLHGAAARWGWWRVQQTVVRSHMRWLHSPESQMISAMVLGSRPVDIPYDVKDEFVQVGLAAALAASGFQTSLILGVVLALTRRWSERVQVAAGTVALLVFVGLTGLQPAVLRAALMGFGGLAARLMQRQTNPLGALLMTAVLLLLWNPLWIWNLGFQLSFLATLGLLVTVPPLTKTLDWLPAAIAPLITVPIAAYLWTVPLQLSAFGVLSPYSIPVNVLTTPLVSILSIGGMISALAAMVWSPAGSALAWLLHYPTWALIGIVDVASQLWGSAYATGTISTLAAIALYGLMLLTWLHRWWQQRWWVALTLGVMLTTIPLWQARATQFQVTVLATTKEPVMVIHDQGRTAVINSGDAATAGFTLLPFLQKTGVNQIDWALALPSKAAPPEAKGGWETVLARLPINLFYTNGKTQLPRGVASKTVAPLTRDRPVKLGTSQFRLISDTPAIARFHMHDQTWLWLSALPSKPELDPVSMNDGQPIQVLCWNGKRLSGQVLAALRPQVAIAIANKVDQQTIDQLRHLGTRLYWTGRDGAIQWTPNDGFKTTLDPGENSASAL